MTAPERDDAHTRAALALTLLGLAIQLWLALRLNVNWDEFYFLNLVHEHLRGTLGRPLQTFHVHLFAWLARLPADEMAQVTTGRLVMLAAEVATLWLLWATARRMAGTQGALLAALAFLAAEFTLAHAASFRADPLAAALLMLALHLVAVRRLGVAEIALAAAAGALAALVTIKAVFYLPAFVGAAIWRLVDTAERRGTLIRLACVAGLGVALFAAGFFWHAGGLEPTEARAAAADAGGAFRTTLLNGVLPRAAELAFWAPRSLVPLGLVALGLAVALRQGRPQAAVAMLFCAPMLSLVFYRNAFPYFFPFILAPAVLVSALAARPLASRAALHWGVLLLVATSFLTQTVRVARHDQGAQRAVLAAVHAAFPEPVPYIDRAGMVAAFPREGFFMSGWGLDKYRSAGVPIFNEILRASAPPMVIANAPALEAALRGLPPGSVLRSLLDADAALLRDTYVPHWGPIWVAGRELALGGGGPLLFEIRVPGPYTLESRADVQIDGLEHVPGSVIELSRGLHVAEAAAADRATLRYGNALPRPAVAPPRDPVFRGFF